MTYVCNTVLLQSVKRGNIWCSELIIFQTAYTEGMTFAVAYVYSQEFIL